MRVRCDVIDGSMGLGDGWVDGECAAWGEGAGRVIAVIWSRTEFLMQSCIGPHQAMQTSLEQLRNRKNRENLEGSRGRTGGGRFPKNRPCFRTPFHRAVYAPKQPICSAVKTAIFDQIKGV
jgi:hypothetical protein